MAEVAYTPEGDVASINGSRVHPGVRLKRSTVVIRSTDFAGHCIDLTDKTTRAGVEAAVGPADYTAQLPRTFRNVVAVRLVDFAVPQGPKALYGTGSPDASGADDYAVGAYARVSNTIVDTSDSAVLADDVYANRLVSIDARINGSTSFQAEAVPVIGSVVEGEALYAHVSAANGVERVRVVVQHDDAYLFLPDLDAGEGGVRGVSAPRPWVENARYAPGDVVRATPGFLGETTERTTPAYYRRIGAAGYSVDFTTDGGASAWELITSGWDDRALDEAFAIVPPPGPTGDAVPRVQIVTADNVNTDYFVRRFSPRQPARFSALRVAWRDSAGRRFVFPMRAAGEESDAPYRFEPHRLTLEITEMDL